MQYDLTPAQKATIVVTLEQRLFKVREDYDSAVENGDRYGMEAGRTLRDSLYSAIRALEPDRPILPENREAWVPRRFR